MEPGKLFQADIDEDNILYLQNLIIKTEKFKESVFIRVENSELQFGIIDDDNCLLKTGDNIICNAQWRLLGQYFVNEEETKNESDELIIDAVYETAYNWLWAWQLVPDKRSEIIKKYLENLPENLKFLSNNYIKFNDPMLISYLFSYLMNEIPLEYIHVVHVNGKFSAFGLSNIEWKINPDPVLEKKAKEEKEEKYKSYLKKNAKVQEAEENEIKNNVDWEKLISLYKNIYDTPAPVNLDSDLEQLKKDLSDNQHP